VGFGWTFVVDGLSYAAVLVGLAMMRSSELHPSPALERAKGQVREGFRYARSVPQLWMPLVMMAVIGTLAFNFQVVVPLFVTQDLGGDDTTFTLLFSVLSLGSLVGALVVARRTDSTVRRVGMTAMAFGVSMALLAVAPGTGFAFVVGPLVGVASIAFMTASTSLVQTEAAPDMRGRVLALQAMVFLGSTPIGGPIVGWIAEDLGARYALAVGALACLGAGAWGVVVARRDHIDEPVTGRGAGSGRLVSTA
jgi:predicted MFS family arabinose efflux permease